MKFNTSLILLSYVSFHNRGFFVESHDLDDLRYDRPFLFSLCHNRGFIAESHDTDDLRYDRPLASHHNRGSTARSHGPYCVRTLRARTRIYAVL
jgi:hypothetical protein